MTEAQMYWFLKLDDVRGLCDTFGFIFLLLGFFAFVALVASSLAYQLMYNNEDDRKMAKTFKSLALTIFISTFFVGVVLYSGYVFLPSTKQMAAIYVIPKIVNNEHVQQIPDKVLTLANEWLEKARPKQDEAEQK